MKCVFCSLSIYQLNAMYAFMCTIRARSLQLNQFHRYFLPLLFRALPFWSKSFSSDFPGLHMLTSGSDSEKFPL